MKTRSTELSRGLAVLVAVILATMTASFASAWFCPNGARCGSAGSACQTGHEASQTDAAQAAEACPACTSRTSASTPEITSTHKCVLLLSHVGDAATAAARASWESNSSISSLAILSDSSVLSPSAYLGTEHLYCTDSSPPPSVICHISAGLSPPDL